MEEGNPSSSAIISAMWRAAHLLWDDKPKIFEDSLALRLSGFKSAADLRAELDRIESEIARSTGPDFAVTSRRFLTAMVVMRSRYVEDEVDQALGRGVFPVCDPRCRAGFLRLPAAGSRKGPPRL